MPWNTRSALRRVVVAAFWIAFPTLAFALDLPDRFKDPEDGALDASQWLLEHKGFLPVPIIITEPAIGYGGGLGVAFFREPLGDAARRAQETGHSTPPDVFALAAFGTENGTKGAAAGGQFTFNEDRYRYRGGVGDVSVNLDFYGAGVARQGPIDRLGYNLKGFFSYQQGMMRLGESNVYAAVRWIYLDLDARLDIAAGDAGLSQRQLARRSSGLGIALEHDSRDNIFTPNRGWLGVVDSVFYQRAFGSSNDFSTSRAYVFHYTPITPDLTLGLRGDGRIARGDVPFYMLPYIGLRGVPVARFQGDNVATIEAEARYDLNPRWSIVGFAGAGRAWGNGASFDEGRNATSGGAGFRYLIARRLGLYIGVDVAKSNVDSAFYITVGNAWR
jgi:hypothetical protein